MLQIWYFLGEFDLKEFEIESVLMSSKRWKVEEENAYG